MILDNSTIYQAKNLALLLLCLQVLVYPYILSKYFRTSLPPGNQVPVLQGHAKITGYYHVPLLRCLLLNRLHGVR